MGNLFSRVSFSNSNKSTQIHTKEHVDNESLKNKLITTTNYTFPEEKSITEPLTLHDIKNNEFKTAAKIGERILTLLMPDDIHIPNSCCLLTEDTDIITIINGKEETRSTGKAGQWVITGPKGERYPVENFNKLYGYDEERNCYVTLPALKLVTMYNGPDRFIVPSWGDTMIVNSGDYLAIDQIDFDKACEILDRIKQGENPEHHIYRIEHSVFNETYILK